jgi:large subunit ribosomal protein L24
MAWTLSIRKGDTVRVIAGRDKGKQGRVLSVDPDSATCTVEHAQTISATRAPTPPSRSRAGLWSAKAPSMSRT